MHFNQDHSVKLVAVVKKILVEINRLIQEADGSVLLIPYATNL